MRLVTFDRDGEARLGALIGFGGEEQVLDLVAADPRIPATMVDLLAAGKPALRLAQAAAATADRDLLVPAAAVRLLPPVTRPGKILCVGYNYRGHNAAGQVDLPEFPEIFSKTLNTLVGPGDPIVLPLVTQQVDYEGELAVVIGRRGRDIHRVDALDHVGGYTVFNDVSARDYQNRGSQWLLGKSFDTFGPLGPALVTADEVPDPQALEVEVTVNGIVGQRATTSDMIFSVAALVAYISTVMTLEPGDIIATGTPAKLPEAETLGYLADGDVVAVTFSAVGTLTSRVVASRGR